MDLKVDGGSLMSITEIKGHQLASTDIYKPTNVGMYVLIAMYLTLRFMMNKWPVSKVGNMSQTEV